MGNENMIKKKKKNRKLVRLNAMNGMLPIFLVIFICKWRDFGVRCVTIGASLT
jgi:hypothetical protein